MTNLADHAKRSSAKANSAEKNCQNELERVIEPLASYICATERPQAALKRALAVLLTQVEQTNQVASARVTAMLERQLAVPA